MYRDFRKQRRPVSALTVAAARARVRFWCYYARLRLPARQRRRSTSTVRCVPSLARGTRMRCSQRVNSACAGRAALVLHAGLPRLQERPRARRPRSRGSAGRAVLTSPLSPEWVISCPGGPPAGPVRPVRQVCPSTSTVVTSWRCRGGPRRRVHALRKSAPSRTHSPRTCPRKRGRGTESSAPR